MTDWLANPVPDGGGFRSPVLLRFFFAHRMDPNQVRALLNGYRSVLLVQHDELQAITEKLAEVATPAARSGRLTAFHGLLTAAAGLHWVNEVEAELGLDDSR